VPTYPRTVEYDVVIGLADQQFRLPLSCGRWQACQHNRYTEILRVQHRFTQVLVTTHQDRCVSPIAICSGAGTPFGAPSYQ
jgi:hypothetical protein